MLRRENRRLREDVEILKRATAFFPLAESFCASLKRECLDHQPWLTRAAARQATMDTSPGSTARACTAPLLHDSRRVRNRDRQGRRQAGSLSEPSALSVKAGQPPLGPPALNLGGAG